MNIKPYSLPALIIPLFYLFPYSACFAQNPDVLPLPSDIPQKLLEVKILSETGYKDLVQSMQAGTLSRHKMPNPMNGSISEVSENSTATVLWYLAGAFVDDFYYRSGFYDAKLKKPSKKKNQPDVIEMNLPENEGWEMEEKIVPERERDSSWGFNLNPMEYAFGKKLPNRIHPTRSVMGKQVFKTTHDLFTTGLINAAIKTELDSLIEKDELKLEVDVLVMAAIRVAYLLDYERNKALELTLAQKLLDADVMSPTSFEELRQSYKPYELKGKFGLLNFCRNAFIFQNADLPAKPSLAYPEILKKISQIIPGFQPTNIQASIISSEENIRFPSSLIQWDIKLSFEADGEVYNNTFFYEYTHRDSVHQQPGQQTTFSVGDAFANGINKWLTDKQSNQRLYFANHPDDNDIYGNKQFGVILLTESQFKAWGTFNSDYFMFTQSHDNRFGKKQVDSLYSFYESIGLFSHLAEIEKEEGLKLAKDRNISAYLELLFCYPKTIILVEWETYNLDNPYGALIREIADASRGAFKPENIQDDFGIAMDKKKKYCTVAFTVSGQAFTHKFKLEDDWLEPGFLDWIESVFTTLKTDGNLYEVFGADGESAMIFLTEKQYKSLLENQPELFESGY
jgi:hypothetical protein